MTDSAGSQQHASDDRSFPFRLDRCGDLGRLRQALNNAGYTQEAIAQTVLSDRSDKPLDPVSLRRRTASPSPLDTLQQLFILAQAVPESHARAVLAPADVDELVTLGLLRRCAAGIQATATLMPGEGLLMAREIYPDFLTGPVPHDYVLGTGPASRFTSYLTVRRSVESAMDLGTGAGFLALLMARHSRQVVATDTNARALCFAALNARLNELPNIELRQGSLFEPVADRQFDLIAANPPFVISPGSQFEYRDSGQPGDYLCEQVIRQAPLRLREGGYCSVLLNWHHTGTEDWAARPSQWVAANGCDAWIFNFLMRDPISYAATWLYPECGDKQDEYARRLDEWLAYFQRLGIGAISFGAIILRKRSATRNWIRADIAPSGEPAQPCGDQIERIFAAQTFLDELGEDGSLLDRKFTLAPDHQLQHVMQAEGGRWVVKAAELTQAHGYPFVGHVDRLVCTVLAGCDGQHTLAELVADLSTSLRADPAQVGPSCSRVIRTLLYWGFLTAVPPA
jgi:methylase of polypeptide subunit release factors